MNGCTKMRKRLLHSENQMEEGNYAVTSFLQTVLVPIHHVSNKLDTYVFLYSGSTVSFLDQSVQEKLPRLEKLP